MKQENSMSNQSEADNGSSQGRINETDEKNGTISSQPKNANALSHLEVEQEIKTSKVRVNITYGATSFIFVGGAFLIIWFVATKQEEDAMAVFNTILPIAAGIVTYWFATRSNRKTNKGD